MTISSEKTRVVEPRFHIKRKKVWGEDGVAATVGTILSLMVFLTFLGMFTNQYVPIWMKDNENKHMNQVIGEMSNLKSAIDLQILSADSSQATAPIYSPIQLQADGVPIFASSTIGVLTFTGATQSGLPGMNISYNYSAGSGHYCLTGIGTATGGSIEFYGPNRYFVQQTVVYENGAILLAQENGEIVLSGISIKISPVASTIPGVSNYMVLMTHTSLLGDNKTVGGFGTKSITTSLDYATHTKVNNSNSVKGSSYDNTLTFNITTKHKAAWWGYYNATFESSGVSSSNFSITQGSTIGTGINTYYTLTIKLYRVVSLEFTKAVASVAIADIGV